MASASSSEPRGAYGKLYGGPVVRDLFEVYTTIVRAVPELVLILLLYFAGTDLINRLMTAMGYAPVDISGLVAGIVVLGFVQGAYSTEVLRGAILAVPQGQIEAARAYGMPPGLLLRRITLPAMLPFAIPGLANLWLIATKDTALLAVVGFSELTLETRQAAGTTKAYFTFFIAAGALYLMLTLFSTFIIARIERWSRRGMPSVAGSRMSSEFVLNVTARQRVLGWLQPHRIVLIAIGLLIVICAALFMRWDWLPQLCGLGAARHLAHDLAARRQRGAGLCARRSARSVASRRADLARHSRQDLLHDHPRHAAAAAALAALLRARLAVPAISVDQGILPVALSAPGLAICRPLAVAFLCRL